MKFFSSHLRFFSALLLAAGLPTLAWSVSMKDVQTMLQQHPHVRNVDKKQKRYDHATLTIFTWTYQEATYRMVHHPNRDAVVTIKRENDVAFSQVFEKNLQHLTPTKLKKLLFPKQEVVPESQLADRSASTDTPTQGQRLLDETFSTSDVLSWNRLLNDVYQGKALGGSAAAGPADEEQLSSATSMAKVMNQCGGQSAARAPTKKAMQNIAQALVAASNASHAIARASEGYTENSRSLKKGSQDSVVEQLNRTQTLDMQALVRSIGQAKRIIRQVLATDFADTSGMQDGPLDQRSLMQLRKLRQKHSAAYLQKLFTETARKLVMDRSKLSTFTGEQPPMVLWLKDRRAFMVNPYLGSNQAFRHALVQALIQWTQRTT